MDKASERSGGERGEVEEVSANKKKKEDGSKAGGGDREEVGGGSANKKKKEKNRKKVRTQKTLHAYLSAGGVVEEEAAYPDRLEAVRPLGNTPNKTFFRIPPATKLFFKSKRTASSSLDLKSITYSGPVNIAHPVGPKILEGIPQIENSAKPTPSARAARVKLPTTSLPNVTNSRFFNPPYTLISPTRRNVSVAVPDYMVVRSVLSGPRV